MMKTDEKYMIKSNQTHLEICLKLVAILEIENNTLHKNIKQLIIQNTKDKK